MKTLGLFFLLLSFSCSVYGQADSVYINELKSECGTEDVSSTFPVFPVEHDTLRILVVFAKFPNDTWDPDPPGQATYYWPGSSSSLPSWATSMIDQDGINIAPNTLTALSRDMSLGRFIVIGDVYPNLFIYPHTSTYYKDSTSGHMGLAIKDLLQGIDANVDYSQYDKFTIGTTSNPRQPDGIVDFILVINRFHLTVDGFNYSGYAALGGSTGNFGTGVSEITLDGKRILAGYPSGSGAIAQMLTPWGYNISMHEIGHYLLGGHRNAMGIWNLMNTNGNSFLSADERETLGWEGTKYTPTGNSSYTISDYATTGDYINFTRGGINYYLEYRRRISYHMSDDWKSWPYYSVTPSRPLSPDSGLFIHNSYTSWMSAQGRYNWQKSSQYPTYYLVDSINNGTLYDFFYIDKSNRSSGESTRDLVNKLGFNVNTEQPDFFYHRTHPGAPGDSNSCFDIGYNQVYSPWSNPRIPATGSSDSLAIEITGKDANGNLQISFYFQNLTQTSPSKPQDTRVTENHITPTKFNPRITWSRNLEPDMKNYKVYRGTITSTGQEPSYYNLAGETTDTTFVDSYVTLYISDENSTKSCEYEFKKYAYKVMAIDSTDKESVYSERDSISGYLDPCAPDDNIGNLLEQEPLTYSLRQNYPNPFNPSTMILYSFPEGGLVSLKVYDITGKEVETLINDYRDAGYYGIEFNGSKLASGVYFYKLIINGYTEVRKMLLIK